jgi:CsoR family transcriptional regulator, copper-sensing transcriptional repressor
VEHHHPPGYTGDKEKILQRLRRIEGQVRGIHRMVEEDTYCIDVLTQVSAVTRALQGVAMLLLDDHVRHCVADDVRSGSDEKIGEAMEAIARLVRS